MFRRPQKQRLIILLLVLLATVSGWLVVQNRRGTVPSDGWRESDLVRQLARRLEALEAREKHVAETVWAKELLAEQCGRVFEQLWDSLNAATNKLAALAEFPVGELAVPRFGAPRPQAHGIELLEPSGDALVWSHAEWRGFLAETQDKGWRLVHTEFRHNAFDVDLENRPWRSVFHFRADLTRSTASERATVEGDVVVEWGAEQSPDRAPWAERIDATRLMLKTARGEPPFRQILNERISPPEKSFFIDPLILYDLDRDGLSEIILASSNLVFHRRSDGSYERRSLCRYSPGLVFTGLIADFDGDGAADFLCARFEGLILFRGSPTGTFEEPGKLVWAASPHIRYGQVLTCGDIDHDGDLDVWLGQYKGPYERGQMPTPYYDANDGNPAYLLLNDGHGNLSDATEAAGLAKKRWRRSYSGSFVDLDADGDLDLMVVNDFAGVDLYVNDGRGNFRDVTDRWLPEPHAFGMAHTYADFNADGQLDFLVIGMHCPTALRLHHLALTRPDHPDYTAMIPRMVTGNRLLLGRQTSHGREVQPPTTGLQRMGEPLFWRTSMNESIARSGWSWGCSAFDFDNDGFPDVYIANGHETRQSVQDYDPEFWLHDIYVGTSKDDVVANAYFGGKFLRTRGRGHSYGGYEKNRLYLNQAGTNFLEIGYLMGVGLEQDCRNVVTDDLDGDGRVDLLVTTFEVWPEAKQTLQVFLNTLDNTGNWIGFQFQEEGKGVSPIGARVVLHRDDASTLRQIVTGDSHRSQHANTVHFGLGRIDGVSGVEIRWIDGRTQTIHQPRINRYHLLHLPNRGHQRRNGEATGWFEAKLVWDYSHDRSRATDYENRASATP
jgi:hypothetical protein